MNRLEFYQLDEAKLIRKINEVNGYIEDYRTRINSSDDESEKYFLTILLQKKMTIKDCIETDLSSARRDIKRQLRIKGDKK